MKMMGICLNCCELSVRVHILLLVYLLVSSIKFIIYFTYVFWHIYYVVCADEILGF
jgi:hypothetical protein